MSHFFHLTTLIIISLICAIGCTTSAGYSSDDQDYEIDIPKIQTVEEFSAKITDKQRPALVFFYLPYCQICRSMKPVIRDLSEEYKGKAEFFQVEVPKAEELSWKYKIGTPPTIVIFAEGKEKQRLPGKKYSSAIREVSTK